MNGQDESKPKRKNRTALIYEILAVILFLGVSGYAIKEQNVQEILKWGIIPLVPFLLSIFYRSEEIGTNIKNIGLAFAGIFAYLNSIGINGLPALALIVFLGFTIANFFSTEKIWSEMMKILGGIVSGSLAQAKISTHQAKSKNNNNKRK